MCFHSSPTLCKSITLPVTRILGDDIEIAAWHIHIYKHTRNQNPPGSPYGGHATQSFYPWAFASDTTL